MKKPLSKEWAAEDRLRVIAALLPMVQDDIYAGRYSAVGRPNITTLQHICSEDAATLEGYRGECEKAVEEHEAKSGPTP